MNEVWTMFNEFMNTSWGPLVAIGVIYLVFVQWLPTIASKLLAEHYDKLPRTVRIALNAILPSLEDKVMMLKSRVDMYFVAKVRSTDTPLDDEVYAIVSKELAEKIELIYPGDNGHG